MKGMVKKVLRGMGYEVRRLNSGIWRVDYTEEEREIIRHVRPYTMASPERLVGVMDATKYVVRARIPGDFVECGVWRGGCVMTIAISLMSLGEERDIYLFDTFEGMSAPIDVDKSAFGIDAIKRYERDRLESGSTWCNASLEDVKEALGSTGYPMNRFHFIKGKVEETLPCPQPTSISLLRLDTDFYESTRQEMIHLYPRLSSGGVLIIDDYGDWIGSKKAVDEYLAEHDLRLLLNRTDFTGRMAVK